MQDALGVLEGNKDGGAEELVGLGLDDALDLELGAAYGDPAAERGERERSDGGRDLGDLRCDPGEVSGGQDSEDGRRWIAGAVLIGGNRCDRRLRRLR